MAVKSTISIIAESLASALEPLDVALTTPETFEAFMLRLGWNTTVFIKSVQSLDESVKQLLELVTDGLDPEDAAEAINLLVIFFDSIRDLRLATDLPATIDADEFRADFPQQLRDYLIADYLLTQQPLLGAVLLAGGIITRIQRPARGKRPPYERLEVAWGSIGNFLHDTQSTLRDAYGWGTSEFAQQTFIENMAILGDAMGYEVFSHYISAEMKARLTEGATSTTSLQDTNLRWKIFSNGGNPATIEFGIDLFGLSPTNALLPGIAFSPYSRGLSEDTLGITDSFSITLKNKFDVSKGILVSIRPGQEVSLVSDPQSGSLGTSGEFLITFQIRNETGAKIILLGSEEDSRYEYSGLDLSMGTRIDKDGASFYTEAAIIDGNLVISPGPEADGFIASLLPSDVSIDADVIAGFDSRRGIHLGGTSGLEINIPLHISLGPLDIIGATISVKAQGKALPITFGATFNASVGPINIIINNIGLLVELSFPGMDGNMGPVNAALRYKSPDGLGLSVDASVVLGGGFLKFDPDKGEYAGICELVIIDQLTVKALGLLTTRLPDGSKGYSLLIIINAEDFEPIQLPLGFKLTGIGGLLAVNRTFDENVLQAGLKTHVLDSILFPKDIIRNAPQILSNLNKVFPPANGHYLFGPVVQISWGTPTLITANIALVLELGGRLRLLILAQVIAVLPDPATEQIRLAMDAVGVVDFDQGTASLDATLHDSRLLKKFVLTGDMAMRLKWESPRNFALAVGGLHPAFHPPANFPKLERISINLASGDNPRIRCEAYFALTANTVQFGAHAELYAAAAGFSIQGEIGFDVLIQFSPFQFLAEFFAQVQLKRGSHNLFKVRVEGALAGPRPLHIKAKATFEIFWWDISIRVDKTLVSGEKPPLPQPIDVLTQLKDELKKPSNWTGQLPTGRRSLVTLRKVARQADVVLLHPLGTLTVKQTIVPLDINISKFAQTVPSGARRFTIDNVRLGEQPDPKPTPVRDFFAPAQFFEMSDDEKLSRPSFEQMNAGITMGSSEIRFGAGLETQAIEFETYIVDKEHPERPSLEPGQPYQLPAEQLSKQARFGAAGASDLRRSGRGRYQTMFGKHQVVKEGWSIVAVNALTQPAGFGLPNQAMSYSEAVQALRELQQQNPRQAANLKILRFQSEVLG